MDVRRFRLRVLLAATGSVLLVEFLRRYLDAGGLSRFGWVWPVILLIGVLLFTDLVFRRLEAMSAAIRRREQRDEQLFMETAVGMVLVGAGCRILRMNPAAERLTGHRSAEMVGRAVCSDLFGTAEDGRPICFSSCLGQMAQRGQEPLTTMALRTAQGKELSVAVSVTALDEGEFSLLFWDMSERTRLEQELARRRRQVESLYQVGREMASVVDLDRNLERLLDKARAVMEADVAGWGTLQESTQELTWQVVVGAGSAFARTPLALAQSVTGRVLGSGRPYVTQNLAADLEVSESAHALVRGESVQAAMAVPLKVRDRQYGVLFIGYRRRVRMSDEDLLLLSNLGSHLSISVENNDLLARMQHIAALEERQRLAREMHDSFGQILTLFGMRLHLMEGMAREGQTEELVAEIRDTRQVLQESHQEVRRSIYQLKESGPALAPLWERWAEHLKLFQGRTQIAVELSGRDAVPAHLPERVEAQLTRVIQEALTNVRNHSGAEHVRLEAYRDGHRLVLSIADDGCGFERSQVKGADEYHFGLDIMRERMESIHGDLEIFSEPGRGTTVRLSVPITGGGGNDRVTYQGPAGR
ncbi:MAG: ATP-binding protein [Bacillota bacterium]